MSGVDEGLSRLLALNVAEDMPVTKALIGRIAGAEAATPGGFSQADVLTALIHAVIELESDLRGHPIERPPSA